MGFAAIVLLASLCLTGCHSHFVETEIVNASGSPVTLLEVDYPSASFGKDRLGSGSTYHYRFKILGQGPTKVLWTDGAHVDHSVPGPLLHEGQEGTLTITLTESTAIWKADLH